MFLRTLACLAICLLALTGLHAAEARRAALTTAAMRPAAPAAVSAPAPGAPQRVNVNSAPLELLVTLKGIGEKKARAIIAYRREHGPFNSLEQFEEVPGIGPALIEQNRGRIVFR